MMRLEVFRLATEMLQYLDPDGLDETVLNIGQIKTILEGQISDLGESIEEEMQDLPYARPDGLYPDMTVGAVIGADDTAQWATRESTGSGAATVRSVQGATVVWNQLIKSEYPSGTNNGVTFTNNGDGTWTVDGTATAAAHTYVHFLTTSIIKLTLGHTYLYKGCPSGGGITTYYMRDSYNGRITDDGNGAIFTYSTGDANFQPDLFVTAGTTVSNIVFIPQLFDLTAMFGSGNEPTTVAEFEAMYPESYYPYSEPTLKPVQIAGIASTDANGDALDGVEWETQTLRAAGSVADVLYNDHVDVRVGVGDDSCTWILPPTPIVNQYGYGYIAMTISGGSSGAWVNINSNIPTAARLFSECDQREFACNGQSLFYRFPATAPYTVADAIADMQANNAVCFYPLPTPTTTPISPALPMTYRVEQGGTESLVVPEGEISAAPVLTVAEPVNMSTELARIWAAIESLGYTRNAAQLSRPVLLADAGSIDKTQKDTAEIAEIETTKEVQE